MLCWLFHPSNTLTVFFISCYYPFGIPCRFYDVEEMCWYRLYSRSVRLLKRNLKLKSLGLGRWPVFWPLHTLCQFWYTRWSWKRTCSVAVTFTLFVNARLTFSPVKYPYCALRCLLLSISQCRRDLYVSVPFILKNLPIAFCSVLSLTK